MNIAGQQAIADMFGVSLGTIGDWEKSGMPVKVRGGPGGLNLYSSAECISWRVETELRKARSQKSPQLEAAFAAPCACNACPDWMCCRALQAEFEAFCQRYSPATCDTALTDPEKTPVLRVPTG